MLLRTAGTFSQVHDGAAKCVRGDDFTLNLTMHHNVIWDCGEPLSDGQGQSFGVVLKGDYNRFYANTVLKSKQADVLADTAKDTKLGCPDCLPQQNRHTQWANSVAHEWSTKGGPSIEKAAFAFWGGMHTGPVRTSLFEDWGGWDFRPAANSSLIGRGVPFLTAEGDAGEAPDIGAYQRNESGAAYWRPGCTFVPECEVESEVDPRG
jgi:hypothetical protein